LRLILAVAVLLPGWLRIGVLPAWATVDPGYAPPRLTAPDPITPTDSGSGVKG
jgi:hypothetical protein